MALLWNMIPSCQFFPVRPNSSSILSCNKSCHSFVYLKKCPFHISYLTEAFCKHLPQCVLYALIVDRFCSVLELYFVFSPITMCMSQLHLLHQSHWEKAISQLGLSSLVVWFKKKNSLKVYLTFLNNAWHLGHWKNAENMIHEVQWQYLFIQMEFVVLNLLM